MKFEIDAHVHSIASGHAFNTINEIMNFASIKNMKLICITDHGPSMKGAPHDEYFEMVVEVPLKFDNCFCLMGCECNIIDHRGCLDLKERFLKNLDVVLVGLHKLTPYPQQAAKELNTLAIVNSMKNHYVDIIAHPYRNDFPVDIEAVVKAAAQYKCFLELNCRIFSNTSNLHKLIEEYTKMLNLCVEYGVYVVIGTDAHITFKLGDTTSLIHLGEISQYSEIIVNNANKFLKILLEKRNRHKIEGCIRYVY